MVYNSSPKLSLLGLDRNELKAELEKIGEKPFRAKQLWHWIYYRGVTDFSRMTTIAKPLQEKLGEHYVVGRPELSKQQTSKDPSHKWLFKFHDGNEAETVFIPEDGRGALCLSSQIGCTLTCSFCHTGTQRLVRNLSTSEIVGQLMLARDTYGEWPSPQGERLFSNIVMMGMGEPLHNYDQLVVALRTMNHNFALRLSNRKITVSSVGLLPALLRLTEEIPVNIAISLNATTEEQRRIVMPITKKYSLKQLLETCLTITQSPNQKGRRITFEYVMMKGFNDSLQDAKRLTEILNGIPSTINLIPYNENPDRDIQRPAFEQVKAFQTYLVSRGWYCSIRTTRGIDISAACGQLGKSFQIIKQPT